MLEHTKKLNEMGVETWHNPDLQNRRMHLDDQLNVPRLQYILNL